jgi:purine-binding chemotaxis protein CheW
VRALLLHLGEDAYAVDMTDAREVVVAPALTELPGAPATVSGVFNLRGEIVPVFDTAALLRLGQAPPATYVVVVETALGPAGLSMSRMGESVELEEPVAVTETPGTIASYDVGGRLAVLIDVAALLAPARIAS